MGEPASHQERTSRALTAIEQATDNYASWVIAEKSGADPSTRKLWVDRVYSDLAAALPDLADLRRAIVMLLEVRGNQRGMELLNGSRAIQDPSDLLDGPWSGPCPGCAQCRPARWSVL